MISLQSFHTKSQGIVFSRNRNRAAIKATSLFDVAFILTGDSFPISPATLLLSSVSDNRVKVVCGIHSLLQSFNVFGNKRYRLVTERGGANTHRLALLVKSQDTERGRFKRLLALLDTVALTVIFPVLVSDELVAVVVSDGLGDDGHFENLPFLFSCSLFPYMNHYSRRGRQVEQSGSKK